MQRLARAGSFGRRKDRQRSSRQSGRGWESDEEDPNGNREKKPSSSNSGGKHGNDDDDDDESTRPEEPTTSSRPGDETPRRRGMLGAVRSVSFSRRNRRKAKGGSTDDYVDEEYGRQGSQLDTGDQRAMHGDDDDPHGGEADGEDAASSSRSRAPPAPGSLHGWLLKRHTREKSMSKQWAKRYFVVDEHRGTLAYSKSEFKRPTVVLPLCDITSVKPLDMELHGPFCFKISCPPVHLTVRSDSVGDRTRWMHGLEHHAGLWHAKNAGSVGAAVTADTYVNSPNGGAAAGGGRSGVDGNLDDHREQGGEVPPYEYDDRAARGDPDGRNGGSDGGRQSDRRPLQQQQQDGYDDDRAHGHGRGGGASSYGRSLGGGDGYHEDEDSGRPSDPYDDVSGGMTPVGLRRGPSNDRSRVRLGPVRGGGPGENARADVGEGFVVRSADRQRERGNRGGRSRRQQDDLPAGDGGDLDEESSPARHKDPLGGGFSRKLEARHRPHRRMPSDASSTDLDALADSITAIETVEIHSDSDDDEPEETVVAEDNQGRGRGAGYNRTTHAVFADSAANTSSSSSSQQQQGFVSRDVRPGPRRPGGPLDAHVDLAAMLSDEEEVSDDEPLQHLRAGGVGRGAGCACASHAAACSDDAYGCGGAPNGGGMLYGAPDEASRPGSCWQRPAAAAAEYGSNYGGRDGDGGGSGRGARGSDARAGRGGGADGDMPWLSAHLPPDGAEHDDPQFRNDGQSRPRRARDDLPEAERSGEYNYEYGYGDVGSLGNSPAHSRRASRDSNAQRGRRQHSPDDNLPPPDEDSWDRGDRGDEDGREESHGGRGYAERAPPMQARPPAHAPSPPSGSGGGRPHRRMGGLAAQARAQAAARHHGGESSPGPSYDEPHDEPPPRRPQQRHMDTHDDYNYDDRHRHPDDGYDDNPRDETYRRRRDQQQRDEPPPYHPSGAGVAADDNFADEDWDDDDI